MNRVHHSKEGKDVTMKAKWMTLMLALVLAVTLAACGGGDDGGDDGGTDTATETETETETPVDDDTSGTAVFAPEGNELITGPDTAVYEVPALAAGTYTYNCLSHPTTMVGTLTVE